MMMCHVAQCTGHLAVCRGNVIISCRTKLGHWLVAPLAVTGRLRTTGDSGGRRELEGGVQICGCVWWPLRVNRVRSRVEWLLFYAIIWIDVGQGFPV
jgi:hypothetical protein